MRKITLSALFVLLVSSAEAQFVKGDRYLSGSFSGHLTDHDLNDQGLESYSVFLSPSVHKFRTDKKAMGFKILLGYNYGKNYTPTNTIINRFGTFGAGIFWQNYVNLGKGFYLLFERGINGSYTTGTNDVVYGTAPDSDIKNYNINAYLTPGLGYKLTDRLIVGLNMNNLLALGFTHNVIKDATSKSTNDALSMYSGLNNTNVGSIGISFGWKLK